MNFREFFDRYGWVIAAGIFVIGFLRVLYGREPFCGDGPGEEHCAREWFAALSGWAAVAAAVPTIISLRKQIAEANRHQLENVEISLMPTFALASRVRELVRRQLGPVLDLKGFERRGDKIGRSPLERKELWDAARAVIALLDDADLVKFNATLAAELTDRRVWIDRSAAKLIELVERYDQALQAQAIDDELHRLEYRVFIQSAVGTLRECLEEYLVDRDDKARSFLLRWNQPANEPFRFS